MTEAARSSDVIDRWQGLWNEAEADPTFVAGARAEDERRGRIQPAVVALLRRYLDGHIETAELRDTFDKKTRKEWDAFGLKGLSGGMFLNMLVKHIPQQDVLTDQLRTLLRLPGSVDEGRQRMRVFDQYLRGLIKEGSVSLRELQPARLPVFASACWHLQMPDAWPVYYVSARQALEREGLFKQAGEPVGDYFQFREVYLTLMTALGLRSWELEYLLQRPMQGATALGAPKGGAPARVGPRGEIVPPHETPDPAASSADPGGAPATEPAEEAGHAYMQWLLARIGHKVGCKVWIAANDQSKQWKGERLGDLSLKALPSLGFDAETEGLIKLIDVLWVKGVKQVVAAFEIEQTTSVYSGILRMSDLVAQAPNQNFPLYIVAPAGRADKVRRELTRPTFQALGLHERCRYISEETLMSEAAAILKWATEPSVMDGLATAIEPKSWGE